MYIIRLPQSRQAVHTKETDRGTEFVFKIPLLSDLILFGRHVFFSIFGIFFIIIGLFEGTPELIIAGFIIIGIVMAIYFWIRRPLRITYTGQGLDIEGDEVSLSSTFEVARKEIITRRTYSYSRSKGSRNITRSSGSYEWILSIEEDFSTKKIHSVKHASGMQYLRLLREMAKYAPIEVYDKTGSSSRSLKGEEFQHTLLDTIPERSAEQNPFASFPEVTPGRGKVVSVEDRSNEDGSIRLYNEPVRKARLPAMIFIFLMFAGFGGILISLSIGQFKQVFQESIIGLLIPGVLLFLFGSFFVIIGILILNMGRYRQFYSFSREGVQSIINGLFLDIIFWDARYDELYDIKVQQYNSEYNLLLYSDLEAMKILLYTDGTSIVNLKKAMLELVVNQSM